MSNVVPVNWMHFTLLPVLIM